MRWRLSAMSGKISRLATVFVMLGALKLGLLMFLGLDFFFPDPPAIKAREVISEAVAIAPAQAQAKPEAKKPEPAKQPEAPAQAPQAPALPAPEQGPPASADIMALKAKQDELAHKEASLKALEETLNQRLAQLNQLEARLSKLLEQANSERDAKLKHLIDVYTNMKSREAAQVLETLDEPIAVKILAGMKGRQAGEILNFITPKKAAKLSEALTKLQLPLE